MTDLLDIVHRLFFYKNTHDVSETGVCLRHQVKDTYSVGPNRASPYLRKCIYNKPHILQNLRYNDLSVLVVEMKYFALSIRLP
jgi:hypothetical protein